MIRLFIQKHTAVFSFAALIVIMGLVAYVQLPRESTPEIKQPYIFITTSYFGVSAADIESLVTKEIEAELDGMDGLAELTSESRQNLSFIFAEFTSDVTVETALQRVKDRVDLARNRLPDDADDPYVREFNVSDWPFFVVVLSHPDGVQMIDDASVRVQEEIERISGVLEVENAGRPGKELAIELNPGLMETYGFSINDVIGAVQQEHISIPGGILQNPEKNYTLAVTGEITDPNAFEDIFVSANGVNVRLGELGSVAFQETDTESYSRLNGTPAITLSVKKRLGANVLDLVDAIGATIDSMESQLPAGTEVFISYDESRYIRDMLADLENNMATGFVLVLLVTIFFLGFRNSLFVSLAIPLSMLMSFFILQIMGVTLNMIVLFSLILALGMLVDNGIVIVENIFRHGAMGKNRTEAAVDGSREVAGPIIASTITTLLAFFPIIFMPGIMGDFMSYLPITVIVVLASSLFVALVINPVFCARFLKITPEQRRKMETGGGKFARIQGWYSRILKVATRHAGKTVAVVFLVSTVGIVLWGMYGQDAIFFPYLDPERVRVRVEAPQGTPLDRTDAIVNQVEEIVDAVPASTESYEGIAGSDGGTVASHRGSVNITFVPFNERDVPGAEAARRITERVRAVTAAVVKVDESDSGPPTGDDVSYEVRGNDYAVLGEISDRVLAVVERYPDAFKDIDTDFEASRPEYQVVIDRGRAAYHGLSTMQIANTVRTAITGATIGGFRQNEEEYDIVVRYEEDARDSLQRLRSIQIVNHDGDRIPLSAVADVTPNTTVSVIKRRNLNRAVNVWANFNPGFENRAEVMGEIESEVTAIKAALPLGYSIGAGAGFDMRADSQTFLLQAFVVAIFLIFIVLITQFNSLLDPFIIIFAVFLSIGGVFWGFFLGRQNFVIIMSGIGTIALAGVAVNNCIVLVDYTHKLLKEGKPWLDAIIEAGRTRLRPVLLTALTTVLALVPMAIGVSFDIHTFRLQIGSESSVYWQSFAWTMLYGLTFATVSTLVVVPSLLSIKYRVLQRRRGTAAIH